MSIAERDAKLQRRRAMRLEFKYECVDVNHRCDFYCNTIEEYIAHVESVHLSRSSEMVTEHGCFYCGIEFGSSGMFFGHIRMDDDHDKKVDAAGNVNHIMYRAFGPVAQLITIGTPHSGWGSSIEYGPLVDRTELGLAECGLADDWNVWF